MDVDHSLTWEFDPWDEKIAKWIAGRETVSVREVLELCLQESPKQCSYQAYQNCVARYLRANGWKRYQQRMGAGKRGWRYRRVNPPVTTSVTPQEEDW